MSAKDRKEQGGVPVLMPDRIQLYLVMRESAASVRQQLTLCLHLGVIFLPLFKALREVIQLQSKSLKVSLTWKGFMSCLIDCSKNDVSPSGGGQHCRP